MSNNYMMHQHEIRMHHASGCQVYANVPKGLKHGTTRDVSSSQVLEDNLDGLQPQQAGLLRLSLNILERYQELDDAAPPCANFKVLLDCMHAKQQATVRSLHST